MCLGQGGSPLLKKSGREHAQWTAISIRKFHDFPPCSIIFNHFSWRFWGEKSVPRCHENGMSRCSFGTGFPSLCLAPAETKMKQATKATKGFRWRSLVPQKYMSTGFVNWGTNLCNYFLCPKSCFPCSKDTKHQAFYGLI